MSEIAQYGVYFRSTSQKAEASASTPTIGRGGVRVGKRVFQIKAMAFTSFRELRSDLGAEVRHGMGIEIEVEATSVEGDVQVNLGAVAAQVEVERISASYHICAKGSTEFVAAVNAKLPINSGKFDFAMQENLQEIVNFTLPESICPKQPPSGGARPPAFVPVESPVEEYPDVSQLVVFACEQMAFSKSFRDAYLLARKRFGTNVDPRPLEYVFQSFGCSDLTASTPPASQEQAYHWIDEVDDYITDFVRGRHL